MIVSRSMGRDGLTAVPLFILFVGFIVLYVLCRFDITAIMCTFAALADR